MTSLSQDSPLSDRLISRAELREFVSVHDMTLHRWIKAGKFPSPVYIGERRFWRQSTLDVWLAEQTTEPPASMDRPRGCHAIEVLEYSPFPPGVAESVAREHHRLNGEE